MELDFSKNIQLKSLFPQTEFEEKVISFLEDWHSDSTTVSVQTSVSPEFRKFLKSKKDECKVLQR